MYNIIAKILSIPIASKRLSCQNYPPHMKLPLILGLISSFTTRKIKDIEDMSCDF